MSPTAQCPQRLGPHRNLWELKGCEGLAPTLATQEPGPAPGCVMPVAISMQSSAQLPVTSSTTLS